MLYLEDYLEMIENLPMEMKERLTEMREVDLQVQNNLDSLDDRVTTFFKKCLMSTNNKQDWKEEEFEAIKKDYYKTLEDTDEKVQLANHVHDLVDRHLRKLDQELAKFKMELEADNAGITEILEKRSLELDKPASSSNSHRAEKRRGMASSVVSGGGDKRSSTEVLSTLAHEAVRETIGGARRPNSATSSPAMNMFSSGGGSNIGASSNPAIAAAASQAIVATQQMQQGRRTSSMKASYDLLTKAQPALPKEVSMGYPATPSSSSSDSASRSQRRQKQTSKTAAMQQQQQQQQLAQQLQQVQPALAQQLAQPATPVLDLMEDYSGDGAVVDDWSSDPNEPRYCLCNQVSYGDMVGCDNKDCPIEWFHYGCVGLAQAPKGKWYCPQCMAAMRRRGRR